MIRNTFPLISSSSMQCSHCFASQSRCIDTGQTLRNMQPAGSTSASSRDPTLWAMGVPSLLTALLYVTLFCSALGAPNPPPAPPLTDLVGMPPVSGPSNYGSSGIISAQGLGFVDSNCRPFVFSGASESCSRVQNLGPLCGNGILSSPHSWPSLLPLPLLQTPTYATTRTLLLGICCLLAQ